jgi:hypothetical protein
VSVGTAIIVPRRDHCGDENQDEAVLEPFAGRFCIFKVSGITSTKSPVTKRSGVPS